MPIGQILSTFVEFQSDTSCVFSFRIYSTLLLPIWPQALVNWFNLMFKWEKSSQCSMLNILTNKNYPAFGSRHSCPLAANQHTV